MENRFAVAGVYCAMMTPFDEAGCISPRVAEEMVAFFADKKLDGIFAVSNVGEFACQSPAEKCALIDACCAAGAGKLAVCPGVTDLNLDTCLVLADHAKKRGAQAVVISPPVYYPYPQAYVEEFLRIFLRDSHLPVIFYHSPRFACPVTPEFLLEIMKNPKVAAIKESSGDAIFLQKLMQQLRAEGIDTPVMLGWEELCLTGLSCGAAGSITSSGGIVPELMRGIFDRFREGEYGMAAKLQEAVIRITTVLSGYGFPPGYKMGVAARGFSMRILRSPRMTELEAHYAEETEKVRALIEGELTRCRAEGLIS